MYTIKSLLLSERFMNLKHISLERARTTKGEIGPVAYQNYET